MTEENVLPDTKADHIWRDQGAVAVIAAFALNGLLFGAWASRVPHFKANFDLDPASLGLLLFALAGGAIVSFPLAGALSERWGAARLTKWCVLGYCPALILLAFAPSPIWLGIFLFIFGAFHGAMDVAMNGWGAEVETRLERNAMSFFHAMFSLGAGLGAASGFIAAAADLEPTLHFLGLSAVGTFLATWAMAGVKISTLEPATEATRGALFVLPKGSLFLVGMIAFACSIGEGAMADWSAVFLYDANQATEAKAALGYTIFSVLMVATRLCGGVAVERFGPVNTTRVSTATALTGLLVAIYGGSFGFSLLGFALMGIGYAVVMPLVFSRAARDPHMRAGPAIASVATLGYGGMLLGPPAIGAIAQVTGVRLSFLALAALAGIAMLLAPKLHLSDK